MRRNVSSLGVLQANVCRSFPPTMLHNTYANCAAKCPAGPICTNGVSAPYPFTAHYAHNRIRHLITYTANIPLLHNYARPLCCKFGNWLTLMHTNSAQHWARLYIITYVYVRPQHGHNVWKHLHPNHFWG